MLWVKFSGNSIEEIAKEAKQFADTVLRASMNGTDTKLELENQSVGSSYDGYRPAAVGKPGYCPVDDGREWNEEAIKDWLSRIKEDGREVVRILAQGKVIDPREEARKLGWTGPSWAGVWTGPRRQAGYVKDGRGLRSWPYGHTYEEPRRLWMHKDIADRVINILGDAG